MNPEEPDDDQAVAPDPRQPELDLGVVLTGDERVDQALAGLEELGGRPVDEHPAVYEKVHEGLQSALVAEPGTPGG
ncbi:MAG: hypothetical protein OEV62_00660 [Actinomycetota bacterium]|nr:hypothetical protein [Actinomycetota bacterium]